MTTIFLRLTGAALLVSLSACAGFQKETHGAALLDAQSLGLQGTPSVPVESQWWKSFGDPQLNALVDQALSQNPGLRVAQARIAKAQAYFDNVHGNDLPQLEAQGDFLHQLYSRNYIFPPPIGGSILDSGTVQASASWELDFFGKNRAALDASIGQLKAAQADAQAARILLSGNVARSYFHWVKLGADLELTQRSLAQREQLRALVHDRLAAGLDTELELQQSQSAIPEARLQIEQIQEQQALTLNALAALTGQQGSALGLVQPAAVPTDRLPAVTSIPLDLLGRRADLQAARWRVEAASSDVDGAKARFYPNINLVAFAGFQSMGFDKVLTSDSQQWGVGPSIRLPIFEAGHLRANLRGKSADLDIAIESYNAQVRDAVREVADQIASSRAIERQQEQQSRAQASAEQTYSIALQRYQAGLATYLTVISAQAPVLTQRRMAVDLAAREIDTRIQLIRALGGGFSAADAL
jgi:NodT family efflux transporter outer membrane factor (OMF) lipoprotein